MLYEWWRQGFKQYPNPLSNPFEEGTDEFASFAAGWYDGERESFLAIARKDDLDREKRILSEMKLERMSLMLEGLEVVLKLQQRLGNSLSPSKQG